MLKKNLRVAPFTKNYLASPDGKTTSLLVFYKRDEKYYSLMEARDNLREKKRSKKFLTYEEEIKLREVSLQFKKHLAHIQDLQGEEIKKVRYYFG